MTKHTEENTPKPTAAPLHYEETEAGKRGLPYPKKEGADKGALDEKPTTPPEPVPGHLFRG